MNHSFESKSDVAHAALPIGALDRAANYAGYCREAAELRASAPVFVAPIDDTLGDHMTGRAILRIGAIPLPTGGVIFFLRVQFSDTQFIWLADATDQDVWRALDAYQKTMQCGFAFRSGEHTWFVPYETQDRTNILERFRSEIGRKDRAFVEASMGLIAYGDPAETFGTMRPGIDVNHYRLCILGTTRVRAKLAEMGALDVSVSAASAQTLMRSNTVVTAPGRIQ
ncbi:hypothetical protein P3T18_003126 [Paraburkholderia sp. GAS199]|uniref:hypothetical protein n=1 Tax=Paraburkholderia sp. GAS199 TaxID=3035126 RepID=UPI003D1A8124